MSSVQFKDFTKKRVEVYFTLADGPEGRYDCVPALSLPAVQELALIGGNFRHDNVMASFEEFFNLVCVPESAKRLIDKMTNDKMDPIDKEQAVEIMNWLLEVYGMRPTQPSSDSSSGSPIDGSGTTSEAGA